MKELGSGQWTLNTKKNVKLLLAHRQTAGTSEL